MAVTTSVVDVNNGNTGWTRQDVLDALETAFYQLGMNGSDPNAGVRPYICVAPGSSFASGGEVASVEDTEAGIHEVRYDWMKSGLTKPPMLSAISRTFDVKANGTSSYYVMEYWRLSWNVVDTTNDTIEVTCNGTDGNPNHARTDYLKDGDKLLWAPGESNAADAGNVPGLTPNTNYYVKRVSSTIRMELADSNNGGSSSGGVKIQLCTDPNDLAGSVVDLTGNPSVFTGNWRLQRPQEAEWENPTVHTYQGEVLYFVVDSAGFNICDGDSYHADRVLSNVNQQAVSYQSFPTNQGAAGTIVWTVQGWPQSETDLWDPTKPTDRGYQGVHSYCYANDVTSAMKGVIKIHPAWNSNNTKWAPYWKYIVPADGSRSELQLRVFRWPEQHSSTYEGHVSGVQIHSIGSGWSDNDAFTIPGEQIGNIAGKDIPFGVNTNETSTDVRDGIASIMTCNVGQGTTMYQKSLNGQYAVLKLVNDSSKTFGTTYWGFGFNDNNYQFCITAGAGWSWLNRNGVNYSGSSAWEIGAYQGDRGLDWGSSSYINRTGTTGWDNHYFATTSTPQSYPLAIRTYRAPNQQDDNFAVISFTQTINEKVHTYATIALHAGPNYGANVFDMDYVWPGTYTYIFGGASDRSIHMDHHTVGYQYNTSTNDEPAGMYSLAREANYGFARNTDANYNYMTPRSTYTCNIDTSNSSSQILTYFRNNVYDSYNYSSSNLGTSNTGGVPYLKDSQGLNEVGTQSDYYKPIKGLPICNNLAPCPYYIPDDFVMLQVSTSPGLTEFRQGDTVQVSNSEIYQVIASSYDTSQTGLSQVPSDMSMGMLFCARTT